MGEQPLAKAEVTWGIQLEIDSKFDVQTTGYSCSYGRKTDGIEIDLYKHNAYWCWSAVAFQPIWVIWLFWWVHL